MLTHIFVQFNAFMLKVFISLKKEKDRKKARKKKLDPTIKLIILYKVPEKIRRPYK